MAPIFPLLGLLLRSDAYGYELKRIVETEFNPYWQIDYAQLYRSLAKLQAKGWVRVRKLAGKGGPDRKIYSITERGRATFDAWLDEPTASYDEFWVKGHLTTTLETRLTPSTELPLVIAGSDDPLLATLVQRTQTISRVTGSTGGLVTLAQQAANIAGAHLRDPESSEYNVSFVQHLVPEEDVLLVNFAVREYGLLVAAANPLKIRGVRDLVRRNVRFLNRMRGTGARLWLHQHLRAARIDPRTLRDWTCTAATYDEIGGEIAKGGADVGPGLRATAQKWGLEFVPLGEERFDLVMPRALYESARAAKWLDALKSKEFRTGAAELSGYDVASSGRIVAAIQYGSRRT